MAKIDEVARASGVSISTVSYALSGKRPVSAETRRRVEEAARKLNYRPNAGARMLAGRRTNIFAVTEPFRADTHWQTHMSFVLATSIAARRHDYDVLLLTDAETSEGMRRVASSGLADAILVLDVAPDDERVALARRLGIPCVFIGIPDDHAGLVCVDFDFDAAARLTVERLASAGHRTIALLGEASITYTRSNFPPRVRDAFLARADELGVEATFAPVGEVHSGAQDARRAIGAVLDRGATGIVVHNSEEVHRALIDEVSARGLSIPEDISMISIGAGFDGATLPTPIDAVPLVPSRSCDAAVELAMLSLEGDIEPGVRLIPPVSIDRGSVSHPSRAPRRKADLPT